jgi:PPM family protein phosphatase
MWFLRKKRESYEAAGLSDIGMVRVNNEDSIFVLNKCESRKQGAESYGVYVIADGMGGHQAGEVASKMAVKVISTYLLENLKPDSGSINGFKIVEEAIQKANNEIYNAAISKLELNSMGTTVTLGLRLNNILFVGHVGDSRAYLMRKGKLQQLTEDHSVIAQLRKEGVITPEEAENHPDRGKILRCLGVSEDVKVDGYSESDNEHKMTLRNGDNLLFCSDGLTGFVSDVDILNCLKNKDDSITICRSLVNLANLKGGGDNISVIVVKVNS